MSEHEEVLRKLKPREFKALAAAAKRAARDVAKATTLIREARQAQEIAAESRGAVQNMVAMFLDVDEPPDNVRFDVEKKAIVGQKNGIAARPV